MLNGYKTLIGTGAAFAAEVARVLGIDIDIGDQAGLANTIVALVGIAVAVYGRIVATKAIGGGDHRRGGDLQ